MKEDTYTLAQAAQALRVSRRRVYQMLHKGELEGTKDPVTERWTIPQRGVREHLENYRGRSHGWGIMVLRSVTGVIFLMSGWQKLSDGSSLGGVAETLSQMGSLLPLPAAVLISFAELLCGAALVLGLFTSWVSMTLAVGMLADLLLVHLPNGFFLENGGYEYALLRLAASVALLLTGPGKLAIDNVLGLHRRSTSLRLLR